MEWQPLKTIPRDGSRVQLLSPSGGIDKGEWYAFGDWFDPDEIKWEPLPAMDGDTTGDLSTDEGYGDYTHWKPIDDHTHALPPERAPAADDPPI